MKANNEYTHWTSLVSGTINSYAKFTVYRVLYKKNYKEKIGTGKYFHYVLYLGEGMDIIMEGL